MHLTKTEIAIVQALSDGQNSAEIAERRFRHKETVRKHIKNAREKLGARTIGQLVKLALQQGLIRSVFVGLMVSQGFGPLRVALADIKDPHREDQRRLSVARSFSVRGRRVREDEV